MKKIINLLIVLFVVIIAGWYLAYLLGLTSGKMDEQGSSSVEVPEDIAAEDVLDSTYGNDEENTEDREPLSLDTDDNESGVLKSDGVASDTGKSSLDEKKIARIVDSISSDDSYLQSSSDESEDKPLLTSAADLNFHKADDNADKYIFTYNGEDFTAIYTTDNWKILNSYKINNEKDMTIICQTLIDEHQIHGRDMTSYRTADDMVYEWIQHNLVYEVLPEDSEWLSHAKDVDLDPKDQNKSFEEIYKDRTGKELSLEDIFN